MKNENEQTTLKKFEMFCEEIEKMLFQETTKIEENEKIEFNISDLDLEFESFEGEEEESPRDKKKNHAKKEENSDNLSGDLEDFENLTESKNLIITSVTKITKSIENINNLK